MNRIVCDTNVIISGFFWQGPPRRILNRIEAGEDMLFISREILIEAERVLQYNKLKQTLNAAHLVPADSIRWLVAHATLVMPKPLEQVVVVDDPADDMIVACALAAGADSIISGDKHLLNIRAIDAIQIISAAEYIDMIGKRGD